MDRDKNAEITYEELVEGSKRDPMIAQVRTIDCSSHTLTACYLGPDPVQIHGERQHAARFEVQSSLFFFLRVVNQLGPFPDNITQ